jgi:hypothetical protein
MSWSDHKDTKCIKWETPQYFSFQRITELEKIKYTLYWFYLFLSGVIVSLVIELFALFKCSLLCQLELHSCVCVCVCVCSEVMWSMKNEKSQFHIFAKAEKRYLMRKHKITFLSYCYITTEHWSLENGLI